MSEYTFTLNAIDRASPVVEEAIQRIRATLESGSAQLSSALRILPNFNQAEFERLLQSLNQVGDQAVERARLVGQQIGESLAAGVGPDSAQFQKLGERLNVILRESLTQARQQIQQFSETTKILPGGTAAGDVLQFAEQWQQAMLRSIQTVAAELRTELNAAARDAGLSPRAVSGQFQGTRVAAASSEALVGTLGTPESTEAFRLRMDQQRSGTSQAAAERVAAAVHSTDEVFNEAVNRVIQGLELTQEHLAELRAQGVAFDLRDPTSRGLTPITGPVGVRDIGQGAPSVYQLRPGQGEEYDPVTQTVQLQRALERATQVLDRESQAAADAAAADELRATNSRNLARLLQDPKTTPVGNALRSGTGDFFERTGAPIVGGTPEDQLRIQTLDAQYQTLLRRRNTQMERLVAQQAETTSTSGLLNRFMGGAGGVGFDAHAAFKPEDFLGNIAGTAGVLARYGGTGIAITSGFRAFGELRTEIVGYQTALVNLQEVLGTTKTQQVDLNGAVAAAAPAGIGAAEAVNLGAEALARYREEIQGGANASTVMVSSLNNIAQAAVLTGQDAKTAGEQLIDATQGFSLGSSGQSRILDAVENARRNYGGDRAQIMQAIGDAGDLARSAGIDPETLANMVALIQARTGASGTSVASSIERTISRQGSSTFRQALGGLGIQDTGNIVTEIEQMSQAWDHLSKTQRDALITQLGGARQARELLPLLEEGKNLLDANKSSYNGVGAAAEQYARQQQTIAGVVRQIGGDLRDLAQEVGTSGMFAFLGPLAVGFRDIVEAANAMLGIFNKLPAPVREVALTLMEAVVAVRVFGNASQQAALGGVVSRIPVIGGFARRVGLPGAAGPAPEATAAETAATAITGAGTTFAETVVAAAQEAAVALQGGGAIAAEELAAGGVTAAGTQAAGAGFSTAGLDVGAARIGAAGAAGIGEGAMGAFGVGAVAMLANPMTYAIAGFIAIGAVTNHMHQLDAAAAKGADALNGMANATDPQGYKTAADGLRSARQQLAQGSSGPFGTIAGFLSGTSGREAQYSRDATYADQMAKRLSIEQGNIATLSASVFGPSNDIVNGLQTMAANGVDANTQLQAVAQALGLVSGRAGTAASSLAAMAGVPGGVPIGLTYSSALVGDLAGSAAGGGLLNSAFNAVDKHSAGRMVGSISQITAGDQAGVSRAIDKAIGPHQAGDILSDQDKEKIANAIAASYDIQGGSKDSRSKIREGIRQQVLKQLSQYQQEQQQGAGTALTDDALSTLLNGPSGKGGGLLATIQGVQADAFDPTGGSGAGSGLQSAVAVLRNVVSRADPHGEHYPELIAAYHSAEDKLAQATIGNLEKLRAAADVGVDPSRLPKVDQAYFNKEIQAAGADTNQLIAVINSMTLGEVAIAETVVQNAQKVAEAAFQDAQFIAAHVAPEDRTAVLGAAKQRLDQANANLNALMQAKQYYTGPTSSDSGGLNKEQQAQLAQIQAGADPGNKIQSDRVAIEAAQFQVDHLKHNTAEWWNAQKSLTDAQHQLVMDQASLSQAQDQASAFPGSALSAATVQMEVARSQLAVAERGTAEWYQAQRALTDAQIAYGNAVLADQANVRLLSGDTTDPVFRARAALAQAQAVLRNDKRNHAPADMLHSQELEVRNDQAALEQAKFQQRLQDAQTLHDLGQMSDAAYMRYLDAELARLEKIKHRTRQETDELYSIEQAIKAASDQMQGQFNLGDIKIPTPYEVRRQIAMSSAGLPYQSTPTTNTTNITINGTDTAMVQRTLWQILGPASTGRTSTTRKV